MIHKAAEILSGTASWFDVIEISSVTTPLTFKNNRLHSITERQNSGYGLRANVSGKTGFSYTNNRDRVAVTAKRALELAGYGEPDSFTIPEKAEADFEPASDDINKFSPPDEIGSCENTIARILDRFPESTVDMSVSASSGSMRIVNSRGMDSGYRSTSFSVSLSLTLIQDDGSRLGVWESRTSLSPGDHRDLAEKVMLRTEQALRIQSVPSGKIPVIMTPRAFARLLGIVGSGLNARSVYRGISPFADKPGEKIFSTAFSLSDDPRLPDSPFSFPFDDEGVTSVRKNLIQGGTIKTFITDLRNAEKTGLEYSGNASRGYASLPYPSFSTVTVAPGHIPYKSMLRGIKKGILVEQFIGLGQSNTLTGDFSASLDLAYLVENGEITGRVKDCMISDNFFSLLAGEMELSSEIETVGSVCAPYVLFPSVHYTG